MSNFLGLATLTSTIQQILREAVAEVVPGAEVTTLRPDDMTKTGASSGINVYLFQVSPNTTLRNEPFPVRDSAGASLQGNAIALDLHYLVSFYGKEERYEPEQLYALATVALARSPILSGERIARAVAGAAGAALAGSDLAAQAERIRLTPLALSLDELQRTWSLFSPTPYRLSALYAASVVLLNIDEAPGRALPVREARASGGPFVAPRIRDLSPRRLTFADRATVEIVADGVDATTVAFLDDAPVATRRGGRGLVAEIPGGVAAGTVAVRLGTARSGEPPVPSSDPTSLLILPTVVETRSRSDERGTTVAALTRPAARTGQAQELVLSPLGQPGRGLSSQEALRFAFAAGLWPSEGKPSEGLLRAFAQNGRPLPADAEIVALGAERRVRSASEPFPEYALRRDEGGTYAFHGLTKDDPEGAVAFAFSSLPAGRYLVRVRIDDAESAVTVVNGVYVGPILEAA